MRGQRERILEWIDACMHARALDMRRGGGVTAPAAEPNGVGHAAARAARAGAEQASSGVPARASGGGRGDGGQEDACNAGRARLPQPHVVLVPPKQHEVFVSYHWRNSRRALAQGQVPPELVAGEKWADPRAIKDALESQAQHLHGPPLTCWLDVDRVRGGAEDSAGSLVSQELAAVRAAKAVVIFLSDEYEGSRRCQLEAHAAMSILPAAVGAAALCAPVVVALVGKRTGRGLGHDRPRWVHSRLGRLLRGCAQVDFRACGSADEMLDKASALRRALLHAIAAPPRLTTLLSVYARTPASPAGPPGGAARVEGLDGWVSLDKARGDAAARLLCVTEATMAVMRQGDGEAEGRVSLAAGEVVTLLAREMEAVVVSQYTPPVERRKTELTLRERDVVVLRHHLPLQRHGMLWYRARHAASGQLGLAQANCLGGQRSARNVLVRTADGKQVVCGRDKLTELTRADVRLRAPAHNLACPPHPAAYHEGHLSPAKSAEDARASRVFAFAAAGGGSGSGEGAAADMTAEAPWAGVEGVSEVAAAAPLGGIMAVLRVSEEDRELVAKFSHALQTVCARALRHKLPGIDAGAFVDYYSKLLSTTQETLRKTKGAE